MIKHKTYFFGKNAVHNALSNGTFGNKHANNGQINQYPLQPE